MEAEMYPVHPAAQIFPLMTDEEYEGLKADIRENGQREAIVVWCNQIIDGRNRLKACQELKRPPQFCELDEERDPWKYVISHNLHRRHLTTSQRAMVASKLATLKNGSNQHKKEGRQNCPPSIDNAARTLNVSPRSVKTAKSVQQHGSEEVKKAVEQGELPVSIAARLVKEVPDKQEQAKILAKGRKAVRETIARKEESRRELQEQHGVGFAEGRKGELRWQFIQGNCKSLDYEDDTFDLVFCSPPYESQRTYGEVGFSLEGDDWVQWAADCFMECLRVCNGLVAWVCEGRQQDFSYSYTPFLLGAELQRRGAKLRKPVVYARQGIPGSGGTDWLRNDWEPIICATKNGKLPWFDISETGTKPVQNKERAATNRHKNGTRKDLVYFDPEYANPGNIIEGRVGAGQMGWKDATKNEAPFPEWLAEFFIKTFCPPGGCVLDPFSGSGTTVAMAIKNGRSGVGIDLRESQVWLGETRLSGLTVKERESGQKTLIRC